MASLKLYLFGTPRLERDDQPVQIRRRKGMALLAYLAITGRPHSREALATLLWPEFDQTRALSNFRRDTSRLKRDIGCSPFLVDHKQISLDPEVELWLDVAQFKTLLATVDEHDHFPEQPCEICLAALTEVTTLYTDDFMAGFNLPDVQNFDDWHFFEREDLQQLLSGALQKLVDWHSRQNEYGKAENFARQWLAMDPLHEPAHRTLMTLYAQDNKRAAALRQYEACVNLLDEELGIEPEPATTILYEAIRTRQFPPAQTQSSSMGDIALVQGNYLEAQNWFQERLHQAQATDDVEGLVHAWRGLGRASLGLDHVEMAEHHFLEALRQVPGTDDKNLALLVLADMAAFYLASGKPVRAAELAMFVADHPLSGQEISLQVDKLWAGMGDLPAERVAEAKERAGQRQIWTTVTELIEEISAENRSVGRTAVSRLPIPSTPFIGRKQELADIHNLLFGETSNRLLTLTGPGGIGKTRLAQEAANQHRLNFKDGAYFVFLARVSSADLISTAIAESVDYQFFGSAEPTDQLLNFLSNKELLLVLDNFEHVVEGAAVLAKILEVAPAVCMIATSREALNISGEVVYHVHGLSIPEEEELPGLDKWDYDSVELLQQEAIRVRPDFVLESGDIPHAARIVRLVQGMPLAVVMAAGWLEVMSLSEIAAEIAKNLNVLETTARDVPERQRSMRAAFDYSWQRLQVSEQQAFMKLSVFQGGFNRQAAQAISNSDLRTLRMLVNKSFLTMNKNGRFEIHELLRQYGWEYLSASGELEQIQAAHSEFFLRALQQREEDIKGKRQFEALKEIEADLENVRAAWKWATQTEREDLLIDSYRSLHLTYHMTGRYHEGVQLFLPAWIRFAPGSGTQPKRIWRLLVPCLAYNATYSGTATPEMKRDLNICLKMAESEANVFQEGECLLALGSYAMFVQQDHAGGIPFFERCLSLFRSLDEKFSIALTLIWLSFAHGQNGNPDMFHSLSQQSLEISLETGNKVVAAAAVNNLGFLTITMGDYTAAENYCRQALDMASEAGRWLTMALAHLHLGLLHLLGGELERAYKRAQKGLQIGQRVNVSLVKSYAYSIFSLYNSISGDCELGRRMSDESRLATLPHYYLIIGNWVRAVSYLDQEDDSISWESLKGALKQAQNAKFRAMITWLLPVAAVLLANDHQPERAVEILALTFHHPQSAPGWVEQWSLIKDLRNSLQQELGQDCYQQAWDRGRELELESTVADLQADSA